jgi:hypothetical protein
MVHKNVLIWFITAMLVCGIASADSQMAVVNMGSIAQPSLQVNAGTAPSPETGCSFTLGIIGVGQTKLFSGKTGDTVVIPITITTEKTIGNLECKILYNWYLACPDSTSVCAKYKPVLKLKSAEPGSLTAGSLFDYNSGKATIYPSDHCKNGLANEVDSVDIAIASGSGFTGSGSIALLTFEITDDSFGKGSVGDLCTPEIPEIRFAVWSENGGNTADGKTCELDGWYPGSIRWATPPKGDGNGDGSITSEDAYLALQMALGKIPQDLILDMDNDGKVTANDARILLQMAQGSGNAVENSTSGSAVNGGLSQTGLSGTRLSPVGGKSIQNAFNQKYISDKERKGATPIQLP